MQPAGKRAAMIASGAILVVLGILVLVIYNAAGLRNSHEDFIIFISYLSIIMGVIIIVLAFIINKKNDGGSKF